MRLLGTKHLHLHQHQHNNKTILIAFDVQWLNHPAALVLTVKTLSASNVSNNVMVALHCIVLLVA